MAKRKKRSVARSEKTAASLHPPKQQRSSWTLERLFEAAESMISERSFEQASINEIVKRAGASVGSFYARFPGKEALLACMLERYHDEMLYSANKLLEDQQWKDKPLAVRAEAYISTVVKHCRQRRGLLRIRLIRNITVGATVPKEQIAKTRLMIDQIRLFFQPSMKEITHPDPEAALEFALQMVDSVAGVHILLCDDPVATFQPVDDTQLIQNLTEAFLAYLTGLRGRSPA